MVKRSPFNKTALQNYFHNIDFPVHRDKLIAQARNEQAGEPFIRALMQIPKKQYSNLDQVHDALTTTGGARPRA